MSNNRCIVCGAYSRGKPQCKDCWNESIGYIVELTEVKKLTKKWNTVNLLFNQTLQKIKKSKKEDNQVTFCNQLIGIGFFEQDYYENAELLDTAYELIEELSHSKPNSQKTTSTFSEDITEDTSDTYDTDTNDFRKRFPCNLHCRDGHYVRSMEEREIDNYLYREAKLLHAYEEKFRLTPEEIKICKRAGKDYEYFIPDFYIPALNLYIEYFGRNDEKYNQKMDLKISIFSKRKNIRFGYLTYKDNNILLDKLEDILEAARRGENPCNILSENSPF